MPAKRRRSKKRENAITPDALAAFKANDRLALHRALDLKPWEASPLDSEVADGSARRDSPWAQSVAKALHLKKQLEMEKF